MRNSNLTFKKKKVDSSISTRDMKGHKYCVDDELKSYALYGD